MRLVASGFMPIQRTGRLRAAAATEFFCYRCRRRYSYAQTHRSMRRHLTLHHIDYFEPRPAAVAAATTTTMDVDDDDDDGYLSGEDAPVPPPNLYIPYRARGRGYWRFLRLIARGPIMGRLRAAAANEFFCYRCRRRYSYAQTHRSMRRHLTLHHIDYFEPRPAAVAAATTTRAAAATRVDETVALLSALRVQISQLEAEIAAAQLPMTRARLEEHILVLNNLRRSLMERLGSCWGSCRSASSRALVSQRMSYLELADTDKLMDGQRAVVDTERCGHTVALCR